MEDIKKYLDEIKPEVIKKRFTLEILQEKEKFNTYFMKKDIYEITDFTKYDNKDFIINSFMGILHRHPEEIEIVNYLNILNSNNDKIKILSNIRFSPEGKNKNVKILGLGRRKFLYSFEKIPFLGNILKVFLLLGFLPKILLKIDKLESKISTLEEENKILKNQLDLDNQNLEQSLYRTYEKIYLNENINEIKQISEKIELKVNYKEFNKLKEKFNEIEKKNKELENTIYNFKKAWFN